MKQYYSTMLYFSILSLSLGAILEVCSNVVVRVCEEGCLEVAGWDDCCVSGGICSNANEAFYKVFTTYHQGSST